MQQKIRNILLSQNLPENFEKTPYADLKKKYCINFDFYKFFRIETISATEFKSKGINVPDYGAIIFSSKKAIDSFFAIMDELKIKMPDTMKYFCITEDSACYLQKYIPYRKRKFFTPKESTVKGLTDILYRHKNLRYLIPIRTGEVNMELNVFFEKNAMKYTKIEVFQTKSNNLKQDIDLSKYDMFVIFSPLGVQAIKENFPDFQQGNLLIGALGTAAKAAATNEGWEVQVFAPTQENPSITAALDALFKNRAAKKH